MKSVSAHIRVLAVLALVAATVTMAIAFSAIACAKVAFGGQAAGSYDSGVYSIDGSVYQALADRESMANGAFAKPMKLTVNDGAATLDVEIIPTSDQYLGELSYYESYAGSTIPKDERAKPVAVKSTYENGYPHEVSFPIDTALDVQWLKVYIPFMEDLSAGSGTQYVRLALDYASMKRTGDVPDDFEGSTPSSSASSSEGSNSSGHSESANDIASTVAPDSYFEMLASAISTADGYLTKTGIYTTDSLNQLREKRDAAKKMYDAYEADVLSIIIQIGDVRWGVQLLEPLASEELDFASLSNGTYTVVGSMVKIDKTTLSMADGAIDHNITVKVKDGTYRLVVGLNSVNMNGKTGYLGTLRYYKTGYKTNAAGSLQGSTAKAKVLSYHTTSSGKRVSDEYGTDYPSSVRIPVIAEAKKDGYVPLSMSVPVMESISKGSGTQAAYLKLETGKVHAGKQAVASNPSASATAASTTNSAGAGVGAAAGASTLPNAAVDGAAASLPGNASSSSSANARASKPAVSDNSVEAGASDDADEASKITVVSPTAKEAPLKGSVPGIAIALVALAIVALGAVSFRKRNEIFK